MKIKLTKAVSLFLALMMLFSAVPVMNVFAESEGIFTYEITNGKAVITECDYNVSGAVTIPDKIAGYPVTEISDGAFHGCDYITAVTIPDSVTTIGEDAFMYCESLESVTIGKGLTTVGEYAFYNNFNLKNVYIKDIAAWCNISFANAYSNPLSMIEVNLYLNGSLLTNLVVPDSVTTIKNYAFYNCNSIKKVFIGKNTTSIGSNAFVRCNNLESVVFENSSVKFSENAFSDYYDMTFYAFSNGNIKKAAENYDCGFENLNKLKIEKFYVGTDLGTSAANLSWNKQKAAIGYKLYRYDKSSKKYVLTATLNAKTSSYKLTGLSSGTVYTYKLSAYVGINGRTYEFGSQTLKFRTLSSSSAISQVNNSISNGSYASLTTVKNTYNELNTWTSVYTYNNNWARVSDVSQFKDNSGNYCVAYADSSNKYLYIRAYDTSLKQVYSRKISMVYPLVGGVVCDSDGCFYVVWGKSDSNSSPSGKSTIAISKYKKSGELVKTTKFKMDYSDSTKYPFDAGNCDIAIYDGVLVCNYGREMYNGHQSNDILAVNTANMTQNKNYSNYVSHSFDQRVIFDKSGIAWFANHGDFYPRGFSIEAGNAANNVYESYIPFHFYCAQEDSDNMYIVNKTKAYLGGIEETSSGIVLVGASVKGLTKSEFNSQAINLFITYADVKKKMPDGTSRKGTCIGNKVTDTGIKWLTNYTSYDVYRPQVVYTDDDRIVILWELEKDGSYNSTYYMILSSNGQVLQKATKIKDARLNSYEKPVYKSGYVYWSTASGNVLKHHKLNINKLKSSRSKITADKLKFSVKTTLTYNGKKQQPKVTVKDSNGNTLKKDTDYTVKYSKGCKNVGQYTVTVTLKGKYSGTKKLTFKIRPKSTSVSKLTAGKKQFKVTWNKQTKQTTGYQIQYSTSSKMKNAKTKLIKKNETTSATVKNLKSGKTYYVRIRTYKTVKINDKNVKIYSAWSDAKKIKTK